LILKQKSSTTFPDIERITDPETRSVFSDLFKVLSGVLTDVYDDANAIVDDANAIVQWEVDGTETQLVNADEIDMQLKKIINVTDPVSAQDAATKAYADASNLWEVDGTETQLKTADEIDMQLKKIINVTDPVSAQDAATKNYADGKISKTTAGEISVMTEKMTLVDNDLFLIEDSAAGNAKKKVKKSNVSAPVLSNVLFSFSGSVDITGYLPSAANLTTAPSSTYAYWAALQQNAYSTVIATKWKKIAGVSTVTVYARIWQASATTANCKVTIGIVSGNANGTESRKTPEWVTFTIDVSSLTNDTVYDVTIDIKTLDATTNQNAYLGSIIAFGG